MKCFPEILKFKSISFRNYLKLTQYDIILNDDISLSIGSCARFFIFLNREVLAGSDKHDRIGRAAGGIGIFLERRS